MKTTLTITMSKGYEWPWFQKFDTFGQFKTIQFGVFGLFVKLDYGFKQK